MDEIRATYTTQAISLFLGFRNNASYSRWWEARKQWGKQLITVRATPSLSTPSIDTCLATN